jgi:hypothetical protein
MKGRIEVTFPFARHEGVRANGEKDYFVLISGTKLT